MGAEPLFAALLRDARVELGRLSGAAIVTGIVGFATLLYLVGWARTWYRLSHVPGPFWAAFSKYWMVRQSLKGQQPYAIQRANEKYGEHCVAPSRVGCRSPTLTTDMQEGSCASDPMSWQRTIPRCCAV